MTVALSKMKIPPGLVRVVVILLLATITVWRVLPYAEGFVDEARSSKAASQARVLQRGAQIAATERLVAGDSFEAAAEYLTSKSGLEHIVKVAGFPVAPLEVTKATLDNKGLLSAFACVVEWEERRYAVSFDIAGQSGSSTLLEEAPAKVEK